jgi:hypothetical protein
VAQARTVALAVHKAAEARACVTQQPLPQLERPLKLAEEEHVVQCAVRL